MRTYTNILHFLRCAFAFILVFFIHSCKQEVTEEIIPSNEYAPYISAYTGGGISQNSTIRIEFAKEQPNVELNTELKGKFFSFTPSLKGKAYWINSNTIEFVPEEDALKPGTLYKCSFRLGDFVEVPKDLRKFEFTFQVVKRDFAMNMQSLSIQASSSESVSVKGELRFSDLVTITKEDVDKMIKVSTTNNQKLTAKVTPTSSPLYFEFTIDDIKKEAENFRIKIEVDGSTLGVDKKISREITIPAKDRFLFLSAERVYEPENGIEVTFSESVSTSQNLKGLITVEGASNVRLQPKDNKVNVFFDPPKGGSVTLKIHAGIRSTNDKRLEKEETIQFVEKAEKPQVELLAKGTILPDSKNLIIPFRAVSLHAVDLSVIRIYESNVLMFLQDNSLSTASELRRSGRLVYKKTLHLSNEKNVTHWQDYSIDLSGLVAQEPGAIYRIMLSFKEEYSAYPCDGDDAKPATEASEKQMNRILTVGQEELDDSEWDTPSTYYNPEYEGYDWNIYEWEERENPCHPSYYMNSEHKVSCNVLASDLGLIVKANSTNKLWVTVNNIVDTNPIEGADVIAYNFQLQPIGTSKTDANGFGVIDLKGKPFVVVASKDKQKTYLKIVDGEENSVSRFNTGGKVLEKGLKGYIYGERGVWRPGDTLHVSFVLEDREKRISDKHPVSIELYNPRGQFYDKQISTKGVNGFYSFRIPTKQEDPTGLWSAYVKVGGSSFYKSLRIETIKPNRLKINLKFPNDIIKATKGNFEANLFSSWLTGATASNLKADIEMRLTKVHTQFSDYSQYNFNNPATNFSTNTMEIFDGKLDESGNATFDFSVPEAEDAPGMLNANITTRVYEPGGDASINTMSVPFSPYDAYVGVNLNQPSGRWLETDQDHVFDVVTVNSEGKPVNRSNLQYKVYRISWSWWWERSSESFASYINNSSYTPVAEGKLRTVNGKGEFKLRINYPEWGRYLVYVKDVDGGHATGGTVYIDWPEYRGRSNKSDPSGVTMLTFSLDKESYEVGETATATIPASSNGRALIAIENGTSVLHREWVNVTAGNDTKYQFKVTPEMAPNVYLHLTLLQPHAQTINDLPIRMYGVEPVFVTNKETILEPKIDMPDVLRPEEEFSVTVSEKKGKPMTYTLAIVDEGLLDLTNFKTPNPWDDFYAREALGITTWDMYDQVIGAFTGKYSSLFGTGGDEEMSGANTKANRFRPVVKYLGPFTVGRGGSNTHKVKFPMYVGSVRTMVVAGQDGAYGSAEKATPVRSPLMILSTLPRVLSTGEDILLPVNVFAMENSVKDVTVEIETSDNLKLTEGKKQKVSFSQTGDKLVYFRIKTGFVTGKEIVKITASGNGHSTKETIEIDVRNPNPMVTLNQSKLLKANESVELSYEVGNNSKDNWVNLETSRIPSVDLSRRFDYLYSYQHCCTEQLTSKALPLLFISMFKDVSAKEQEVIKKNVQEAIKKLYERQLNNGGFMYWPGYTNANDWVSTYAGIFLVMAYEKGFAVNPNVINKWKAYQRNVAKSWTPSQRTEKRYYWESDYQQAYRLYSLALAGAAEQGAMNRLKEVTNLPLQAKWRLAAAYALSGKMNVANELVFNIAATVEPYPSYNNVYGSYDRDEAMILETLVLMGQDEKAFEQAKKVSKNLSAANYFSTQSTAYSLMAMGMLAEKLSGSIDFEWTLNGKKQTSVQSKRAVYQTAIPTSPLKGKVVLKNQGGGALYVDLISRTQLAVDTLSEIANNLRLEVRYVDMAGKAFAIDKIKQGADFKAIVKISNISGTEDYRDIALTHIIPSGWEIFNERMVSDYGGASSGSRGNFDYQDIRDDRVLTYFDLRKNQYKEITIRLQATYAGEFVLPAVQCEAMYDISAQGRTKAGRVVVER
ncbi:alpha-2-macroglobulin [Bacteroides sp. 224]|uniref:alpha-2-macroglobulin family protein n=1 Tax=Bacteroides sp. 224 TaxID=2302936 RepID=UPI0013D18E01|nr:MG2 domain-containing protein [Bacteroides sp. 224]NDV65272.1 alpha-2-macroglobulin [Bacteroides sp. 224]